MSRTDNWVNFDEIPNSSKIQVEVDLLSKNKFMEDYNRAISSQDIGQNLALVPGGNIELNTTAYIKFTCSKELENINLRNKNSKWFPIDRKESVTKAFNKTLSRGLSSLRRQSSTPYRHCSSKTVSDVLTSALLFISQLTCIHWPYNRLVGKIHRKGIDKPLYFLGWEQGPYITTVMQVMEEKIHMFLNGQSARFGPLGEKVSWTVDRAMPDEMRLKLKAIIDPPKEKKGK